MAKVAADAVLIVHFMFVVFVVGGLVVIWTGHLAGWSWVRNRRFRLLHLAAIVFVTAEALLGVMCPLTTWEDALRGADRELGTLARWIHAIMFYELPSWVFAVSYLAFALLVALTYRLVPPGPRAR